MTHLLRRYEKTASEYYDEFKNNEESFTRNPLKFISKLTHNILGAIDYERIRKIRDDNYDYLDSKLGVYYEFDY